MFRVAPEVSVLSSKSRPGISNLCLLIPYAGTGSDVEALAVDGRSFHAVAAVAGKTQSFSVERRVDVTTSVVGGTKMTTIVDIGGTAYTVGNV